MTAESLLIKMKEREKNEKNERKRKRKKESIFGFNCDGKQKCIKQIKIILWVWKEPAAKKFGGLNQNIFHSNIRPD